MQKIVFKKNKQINKKCDISDCEKEGVYPAPKSRNQLKEYNYFCIDHVRDFNKSWNYFDGLNDEEFEIEIRKATTWDRPSWKFGTKQIDEKYKKLFNFVENNFVEKNCSKLDEKLLKAWKTLDLKPDSSLEQVKKKYKVLAKKWHPDTISNNDENKKIAKEKFLIITNAYKKITKSFSDAKINH